MLGFTNGIIAEHLPRRCCSQLKPFEFRRAPSPQRFKRDPSLSLLLPPSPHLGNLNYPLRLRGLRNTRAEWTLPSDNFVVAEWEWDCALRSFEAFIQNTAMNFEVHLKML